jgi:hypothetical protein
MIVTPFGDLSWGDKAGLDSWMAAHDQRHHTERLAIARTNGVPMFPRDFNGPINQSWFGSHMLAHSDLMEFAIPDQTVGAVILEGPWRDEAEFYRWHQIHNLLHQRLDRALGISS